MIFQRISLQKQYVTQAAQLTADSSLSIQTEYSRCLGLTEHTPLPTVSAVSYTKTLYNAWRHGQNLIQLKKVTICGLMMRCSKSCLNVGNLTSHLSNGYGVQVNLAALDEKLCQQLTSTTQSRQCLTLVVDAALLCACFRSSCRTDFTDTQMTETKSKNLQPAGSRHGFTSAIFQQSKLLTKFYKPVTGIQKRFKCHAKVPVRDGGIWTVQ